MPSYTASPQMTRHVARRRVMRQEMAARAHAAQVHGEGQAIAWSVKHIPAVTVLEDWHEDVDGCPCRTVGNP